VLVEDLIDFTPKLRAEALDILDDFGFGSLFKATAKKETLVLSGLFGGANWNGVAFNPETSILYVPSETYLAAMKIWKGWRSYEFPLCRGNRSRLCSHFHSGSRWIAAVQVTVLADDRDRPQYGRPHLDGALGDAHREWNIADHLRYAEALPEYRHRRDYLFERRR